MNILKIGYWNNHNVRLTFERILFRVGRNSFSQYDPNGTEAKFSSQYLWIYAGGKCGLLLNSTIKVF